MSIKLPEKKECCGCGACANCCPLGCIDMREDAEGFCYPQIDKARCISCGKCMQACRMAREMQRQEAVSRAYACRSRLEKIVMESSSGGAFTELAAWILERGGRVYGAAFDENMQVHHIGVDKPEELVLLRGSKYIESRIGRCYQQVKEDLSESREVLFSGTPCQITGLKAFLGKEYEKLYCVDVICHGVPSPLVWRKYLALLEKKWKKNVGGGRIVPDISCEAQRVGTILRINPIRS